MILIYNEIKVIIMNKFRQALKKIYLGTNIYLSWLLTIMVPTVWILFFTTFLDSLISENSVYLWISIPTLIIGMTIALVVQIKRQLKK